MNALLKQAKKIEKELKKVLSLNEKNITYDVIPWEFECLTDEELDFLEIFITKYDSGGVVSEEENNTYNLIREKAEKYYEESTKSC